MLAWIFQVAKKRPNFLVGGVAENFGRSYGLGGGEDFILEGDEYDSAYWDKAAKFFHYHPDDLIITSLEFDHADIYSDFETYQLAFRRLVNLVPRRGRVVVWGDSDAGKALHNATEKAFCPVIRYGFNATNDWFATNVQPDGDGMKFLLNYKGKTFAEFRLAATGHHNVLMPSAAYHRRAGPGHFTPHVFKKLLQPSVV
jgi:UDP-N-acetylmuramate-alanine ligase